MSARLQRAWMRRGALATALWPVSQIYRALIALRRMAYWRGLLRTESIPVPIVVVGNVIAGGAGKTPVVIALMRHLAARGIRAGVVSRGYGRSTQDCREVRPGDAAASSGDEPLLITRATGAPVFVARERAEAVRALLAAHRDVQLIVCDDGLQHLALKRDLEICVFDERAVGNGWLLPAGPLREAWPRGVDFVLRPAGHESLGGYSIDRGLGMHAVDAAGQRVLLSSLAGQSVTAVAGIAQPDQFFSMLRAAGVAPTHCVPLADHFDFSEWTAPEGVLVCTEKDAVKIWPRYPHALAVPLEVQIDPAFWRAFDVWLDHRPLSFAHGHQTA